MNNLRSLPWLGAVKSGQQSGKPHEQAGQDKAPADDRKRNQMDQLGLDLTHRCRPLLVTSKTLLSSIG